MVVDFILGAIGGVVVGVMGKSELGGPLGALFGYLGSIPVSIIVFKKILNKQFSGYSIALVKSGNT